MVPPPLPGQISGKFPQGGFLASSTGVAPGQVIATWWAPAMSCSPKSGWRPCVCVCVGVCFGGPFPSSGVFLEEFFSALGGGSSLGALAQPQVGVSPWEEAISASWWGSLLGGGPISALGFSSLRLCISAGWEWGLFLGGSSSALGEAPLWGVYLSLVGVSFGGLVLCSISAQSGGSSLRALPQPDVGGVSSWEALLWGGLSRPLSGGALSWELYLSPRGLFLGEFMSFLCVGGDSSLRVLPKPLKGAVLGVAAFLGALSQPWVGFLPQGLCLSSVGCGCSFSCYSYINYSSL